MKEKSLQRQYEEARTIRRFGLIREGEKPSLRDDQQILEFKSTLEYNKILSKNLPYQPHIKQSGWYFDKDYLLSPMIYRNIDGSLTRNGFNYLNRYNYYKQGIFNLEDLTIHEILCGIGAYCCFEINFLDTTIVVEDTSKLSLYDIMKNDKLYLPKAKFRNHNECKKYYGNKNYNFAFNGKIPEEVWIIKDGLYFRNIYADAYNVNKQQPAFLLEPIKSVQKHIVSNLYNQVECMIIL